MSETTVSSKYQVVIPKEIRERVGIRPGQKLRVIAKGKGEVFHAGSCEWVAGLLRKDAMVEKVTRNVMDRYLGKGVS